MKKIYFLLFLAVGLGFTVSSCSSDDSTDDTIIQDEEPLTASFSLNVSYGENPQQVYDIYLPEGRSSEKTKVIILVHGGGWTAGDKEDMENFVELIQQFRPNHAIVNINYILANTSPPFTPAFPNQFLDLGLVIDQIISQKENLNILPEFGLIGTSAGAHISLMYDYVYDTEDVVKMVCDIVGPTNFTDPHYADNPLFGLLLDVLVDESAYPFETNYAEATSPALNVSSSSSPSILFYGNQDPLVPLSNGELLEDNLSNTSIDHSFTVYNGGHGDWDESSLLDLNIKLTDFIDTYLPVEE